MDRSVSLRQLQQWMQEKLVNPKAGIDRKELESYIRAGDQLSPFECLGIYRTSYDLRLIECMRKKFSALFKTLGPELFDEFSRMYLHEHPSNSPSLMTLGDDFPDYLEKTRPDIEEKEQWIDFMIEMAQFEIDLYRVFDQEGSEEMTFADQNTPDDRLQLQKAFDLGKYSFDVHRYYQQISKGEDPVLEAAVNTCLAFVRRNYHVYVISLTPDQYLFLLKFKNIESICDAIEASAIEWGKTYQDVQDLWNSWKELWIKEGFFIVNDPAI